VSSRFKSLSNDSVNTSLLALAGKLAVSYYMNNFDTSLMKSRREFGRTTRRCKYNLNTFADDNFYNLVKFRNK
jgi:hypothetical protein